jgi:hypothetical protein
VAHRAFNQEKERCKASTECRPGTFFSFLFSDTDNQLNFFVFFYYFRDTLFWYFASDKSQSPREVPDLVTSARIFCESHPRLSHLLLFLDRTPSVAF